MHLKANEQELFGLRVTKGSLTERVIAALIAKRSNDEVVTSTGASLNFVRDLRRRLVANGAPIEAAVKGRPKIRT